MDYKTHDPDHPWSSLIKPYKHMIDQAWSGLIRVNQGNTVCWSGLISDDQGVCILIRVNRWWSVCIIVRDGWYDIVCHCISMVCVSRVALVSEMISACNRSQCSPCECCNELNVPFVVWELVMHHIVSHDAMIFNTNLNCHIVSDCRTCCDICYVSFAIARFMVSCLKGLCCRVYGVCCAV